MSNITKYALESSLKKMMLTKPLDKITIRDLTEDCGISRMAFYYHFKDIYDLDAWLDEGLGKEGTPERERNREKAWEEYNAQILLDARKNAHLTQAELAKRLGVNKGYISRIERGLTVPTVATLYKIAAAMGMTVELRPL